MTTHYAEPNYIDYDAVQRVFQLLVQAALMKRTTMFDQVRIAIQVLEPEETILRGYGNLEDGYPTAEETLPVIAAVAQACRARNLPPLTVLITKEGKNVGVGFWKDTPLGDLWTDHYTDHGRRQLELLWRKQCYEFFDPFSAMNSELNGYIQHVYRLAKEHSDEGSKIDLYRCLSEADNHIAKHNRGLRSDSELHRWIRDHFVFDYEHSKIVDHDLTQPSEFTADVATPTQHRALVTLRTNEASVAVIGVAFAAHLAMGVKPTGLLEFNIRHVNLNNTEYGKVVLFTEQWVGSGRQRWQYTVRCEIKRPEDGASVFDTIEIDVDPARGDVTARTASGYSYTVVAELVVGEL